MAISACSSPHYAESPLGRIAGDVAFVAEIDRGFHERARLEDVLAPALIEIGQRAAHLSQGLMALRLRLGLDKVRQPFNLREIYPAVLEGAAREFAGLGEATAGQPAEGRRAQL